MLEPASAHVFYKTAVHCLGWAATLTPIKNEFRPHRLGKYDVNTGLFQYLERILIRRPVPTEWRRGCYFKRL